MALRYSCPSCEMDITVLYLEAGRKAKCKKCGAESLVPPGATKVRAQPPPLARPATSMGEGHALGHRLREIIKTGFVKYTAGTVALVLVASLLMFFFEYDNYASSVAGHLGKDQSEITAVDTFLHTLWWSLVTFTTVGYGDISPASHLGKFFGAIIMLSSFFWAILLSGVVASFLVEVALREDDTLDQNKFKGHTIIAGWNLMVEDILKVMQDEESTKPVVIGGAPLIILINEMPRDEIKRAVENFDRLDMTHLSGRYTQEVVLEKAIVDQAENMILVPDRSGLAPEDPSDENVIPLAVFAVRSLTDNVRLIAHISNSELKEQLVQAGCDEIVLTDEHTPDIITNHILNPGVPQMVEQIGAVGGDGHRLEIVDLPPLLIDSTHLNVFSYFKENFSALLLGYTVQASGFDLEDGMGETGDPLIRQMIMDQLQQSGIKLASEEKMELEVNPSDDYQVSAKNRCVVLMSNRNAESA